MRSFFVLGSGLTPRERSPFVLLDGDMDADATVDIGLRGPSPPKQARLDGTYSPSIMLMSPSSGGHHKPSEEELDEEGGRGNWEHKRSRTESHPRSISAVWSSWHEILLPRCHFARGVQGSGHQASGRQSATKAAATVTMRAKSASMVERCRLGGLEEWL